MERSKSVIPEKSDKAVLSKSNKQNSIYSLRNLTFRPFITGTLTFLVFLAVTLFIDFIVNIFSGNYKVQIGIFSLLISFAGFILGFVYRVLEMKKNKS